MSDMTFRIHPAINARSGVTDHTTVHLGAKLLGTEQHEAQVSSPFREIHQHSPHVSIETIRRRILI